MKRNYFSGLFALLLFSSFVVSNAQGSQERDMKGFDRVAFGISGKLYIDFGSDYKVVLEGDESILREIITETRDGRLLIRMENNFRAFRNMSQVIVRITMPEITELSVSGSGDAEITERIPGADRLRLNVSGSGKLLAGDIEADQFDCTVSGSGGITITGSGSADRGSITISGSGNYNGEQMEIDHLTATISGSGNCNCKAGDSLTASVSGSGNITYGGDPSIDSKVSGSGKIRSR